MNAYITRIKLFFGFLAFALMSTIVMGIEETRYDNTFTSANAQRIFSYPLYELASRSTDGRWLAGVAALFDREREPDPADEESYDVPVLVYHGIVKTPDRFSLTPERFMEHMFALKRAGYRTITIDEFERFLDGERPKGKVFLLTFDDGRADSYYQADPILKALDYTAVMYVAAQSSLRNDDERQRYYLTEEELAEMLASGRWEIGSHAMQETGGYVPIDGSGTRSNFLSNFAWREAEGRLENQSEYEARVARELGESKRIIEDTFDVEVSSFSYPFGDYGQQTINNPGAEGAIAGAVAPIYRLAFRQVWPRDSIPTTSNYPDTPRLRLRRIEPDTGWSGGELAEVMDAARTKLLPYAGSFDNPYSWKTTWGTHEFNEDDSYRLMAKADTNGAFGFLDGTYMWRDYAYTLTGEWEAGTHLSLVGRLREGDTYVLCTYSGEETRVEEHSGGARRIAARTGSSAQPGPVTIGMRVHGNAVTCYDGDREVVSGTINSPFLDHGGIGVRVWNDHPGDASFIATGVTVDAD